MAKKSFLSKVGGALRSFGKSFVASQKPFSTAAIKSHGKPKKKRSR